MKREDWMKLSPLERVAIYDRLEKQIDESQDFDSETLFLLGYYNCDHTWCDNCEEQEKEIFVIYCDDEEDYCYENEQLNFEHICIFCASSELSTSCKNCGKKEYDVQRYGGQYFKKCSKRITNDETIEFESHDFEGAEEE